MSNQISNDLDKLGKDDSLTILVEEIGSFLRKLTDSDEKDEATKLVNSLREKLAITQPGFNVSVNLLRGYISQGVFKELSKKGLNEFEIDPLTQQVPLDVQFTKDTLNKRAEVSEKIIEKPKKAERDELTQTLVKLFAHLQTMSFASSKDILDMEGFIAKLESEEDLGINEKDIISAISEGLNTLLKSDEISRKRKEVQRYDDYDIIVNK